MRKRPRFAMIGICDELIDVKAVLRNLIFGGAAVAAAFLAPWALGAGGHPPKPKPATTLTTGTARRPFTRNEGRIKPGTLQGPTGPGD